MTKRIVSQRVTNLMTIYQKSRGPLQNHLQDKGKDPSRRTHRTIEAPCTAPLVTPGHCTWIIYKRLSREGWRLTCPLSTWARLLRSSTFHPAPHPSPTCPLPLDQCLSSRSYSTPSLSPPPSPVHQRSRRPFRLSSHPLVLATEGCHAGLTRCICLSRPLLLHRRRGVQEAFLAYARASRTRAARKNPD